MSSHRLKAAAVVCFSVLALRGEDQSPPPILQWFESSFRTLEERTADLFLAGYGFVWVPPPYRANSGDGSTGYDPYDRFDLGSPGRPTLYGTEEELKALAGILHRAGLNLHVDFIVNHNGTADNSVPGFAQAGGYPGLAVTLPNDPDGDFHPKSFTGDIFFRLAGLIDIAQEKNHRFIRNPVNVGDPRNIPAGTTPQFGRLANVPDPANRRFYPRPGHRTVRLSDPILNQQNIAVDSFDVANPLAGVPTVETAMEYLMRNAQWLIQAIGIDGLRVDAAKHVQPFVLDRLDRAVYRQNQRPLLDGSRSDVFLYSEVLDGNPATLRNQVKKTINPADIGRIGANRDTLDFSLYFALRDGLDSTSAPNAWNRVKNAGLDMVDDGLHNGSSGVSFVQNHDMADRFALENVGFGYTLMMPGNTVVYFNGNEFGENKVFPHPGRDDALSIGPGSLITRLVNARNTHGRGDYKERWDGADGLFAFEREGSALVLLSNRADAGFDSRTLANLAFRPGTLLKELSGNAADTAVNPRGEVPQVLRVFEEGGVAKVNVRFQRPGTIVPNGSFLFHGKGLLVYGLPTPESDNGIQLTNVDRVLPGSQSANGRRANGLSRQADLHVIRQNSFEVRLQTRPVRLLGAAELRDIDADGDEALLHMDGGIDCNANGAVDFRTPGQTEYGFERFLTKRDPLIRNHNPGGPRGDGEFRQLVDATKLAEGMHFITVRAYRHQPAGSPPVFTDFKKVIYVDRKPPVSAIESAVRVGAPGQARVTLRSVDGTANRIHVFANLPASVTQAQVLAQAASGQGQMDRMDRALYRGNVAVANGPNVLTVLTFEASGNFQVQRLAVTVP